MYTQFGISNVTQSLTKNIKKPLVPYVIIEISTKPATVFAPKVHFMFTPRSPFFLFYQSCTKFHVIYITENVLSAPYLPFMHDFSIMKRIIYKTSLAAPPFLIKLNNIPFNILNFIYYRHKRLNDLDWHPFCLNDILSALRHCRS